jgi:transcriptional regulator with XRE-family HTH domain
VEEPKKIVGANVREQRKRRKWTQEHLAHEAGMHINEISRTERGIRDLRVSSIVRIARALDVSATLLMKGL